MTDKWYDLDGIDISKIIGRGVTYTCYLCDKSLNKKENNDNYFHKTCYELLRYYLVDHVYIKDICNIIIRKIR